MENKGLLPGERYFQEVRTANFRKEDFQYIHTGIVDEAGETWTTTELDEANVTQVYNQYRAKHGIPFPDEIKGLRQHYGMSAAKMAQILGFGINQYRMYEDGEVPSISNARVIIAAREKDVFMSFVEASRSEMAEPEFARIKKKAQSADGDYVLTEKPSVFTGYRSLSYPKIAASVITVLLEMGATFVTKMNKVLFYIDFLSYKRYGFGITGLSYRALQFGPVPTQWPKVYGSLTDVDMEEYIYPSGQSGIKLRSLAPVGDNMLSENERTVIKYVCCIFKDMSAGEVSDISHKERAWINNIESHSKISYQEAFALNYDL